MEGELIKVFTRDGIELQGFHASKKKRANNKALLHLHGFAGNFYWNRFYEPLAKCLLRMDISFLTINTRGHDTFADFIKKDSSKLDIIEIGAAYEILKDSVWDVRAWIDFLEQRGCSQIILQGHSTGAIKAVYYLSNTGDKRISGLSLISPSDDVGLQREALGERFLDSIKIAQEMVSNGQEDEYVPEWCFDGPISAATYLDMFGPEGSHGIFRFSDPSYHFNEISKIDCPILVVFGTVKEAVVKGDVRRAITIMKKKIKPTTSFESRIIEGAPHTYLGFEDNLASTISGWLQRLWKNGPTAP